MRLLGMTQVFVFKSEIIIIRNRVVQFETFEKGCIKNDAFEFKYTLFGLDVSLKINVSLKSHVII